MPIKPWGGPKDWGGKRAGAGRKPGPGNRKSVNYYLDDATAKTFAERCKRLGVSQNTVLETLMTQWTSGHLIEIDQAPAELKAKVIEEYLNQLFLNQLFLNQLKRREIFPRQQITVPLDDYRLALLLQASDATGRSIYQLIEEAVSVFLEAQRLEVRQSSGGCVEKVRT